MQGAGANGFVLRRAEQPGTSPEPGRKPGYAGEVPGLGPVQTWWEDGERDGPYTKFARHVVTGAGIPQVAFEGVQFGRLPLPARVRLQVAGQHGRVSRRRSGVTRQGRALRIETAGRIYRYRQGADMIEHHLVRDGGATVRVTRDRWRDSKRVEFSTSGPVDAMDIALALLMSGVYTRHMSQTGRWMSLPLRFTNRWLGYFGG
ncbi:hypothetical protein H9Y04_45370 [Streptomyces sp. TRM66268-LWL]|uniref:Uncharacterized protein n=1 Tax=Streptomyces polyasparticus TaxID=2767826 RepID=A0ABR7SYS4_9ACTN|nr:hypothetical protein [Streptomyces polyasparticus]MBC9719711.1 hypothetical protein [Streptomyces polyasparticus]